MMRSDGTALVLVLEIRLLAALETRVHLRRVRIADGHKLHVGHSYELLTGGLALLQNRAVQKGQYFLEVV